MIFANRNVVQEKQRLGALGDDIVDAHRDDVLSNGIMLIHHKGQFQLRPDSICTADQHRLFHVQRTQIKQAAEAADAAHHAEAAGFFNVFFNQTNRLVSSF